MNIINEAIQALDAFISILPEEGHPDDPTAILREYAEDSKTRALRGKDSRVFRIYYGNILAGTMRGADFMLRPGALYGNESRTVSRYNKTLDEMYEADPDQLDGALRDYQARHGIVPRLPRGRG